MSAEEKEVYKVVNHSSSGKLLSAIIDEVSKYCIKYKEGEFVFPHKGTKLLCFEVRADAEIFAINNSKYGNRLEVWLATATNTDPLSLLAISEGDFLSFWKDRPDLSSNQTMYSPYGTVSCDSIRLDRKLSLVVGEHIYDA